jgi:murein hydrolase activator
MTRLSTYRNLILRLSSFLFFAALLIIASDSGKAQNRKELENKRKQKENEILQTKKRLAETNKKEKKTLAYLKDLKELISERESLIGTLQNQLSEITNHIGEEADIVNALEKDVDDLKQEYAKLLYYMYKNRRSTSVMSFVFATNSFNDAIKRVKFIQYYSKYRERQVDLIERTEASLGSRITDLKSQQEAKKEVLASLDEEKKSLESDKREQNALMQKLQKDEKSLRRQLAEQQKVAKKLDNAIRNIIKKEIALATKKARSSRNTKNQANDRKVFHPNKNNPKPNGELENTPEMLELSSKFASNKSRLPWPVDRGAISQHFGVHAHPTLDKCTVNCNGVVIRAADGAKARCIFGGTVSAVISIPGANNAVIVNHGSYFTVYSNLDQVYVHKGDKISTRQEIGVVGVNHITGESEIELEIWKAPDQKLDPEYWLVRR